MIFEPMLSLYIAIPVALIVLIIVIIKEKKLPIIELLLVICLFLINLRPMIPSKKSKVLATNLDIIFAIDTTISMNAEDYGDNLEPRLNAVKKDLNKIINYFPGASYAVITFDNISRVAVPITKDTSIVREVIDLLKPGYSLNASGTDLDKPIKDLERILSNSSENNNKITILFYVSDGEVTDDRKEMRGKVSSYSSVGKYVDGGAILGYGTRQGGYMREIDPTTGRREYVLDDNYDYAISRIDTETLNKIAFDTGLPFIHMEKSGNIDDTLKKLKELEKKGIETEKIDSYSDLYFILVIPTTILLFALLYRYKEMR